MKYSRSLNSDCNDIYKGYINLFFDNTKFYIATRKDGDKYIAYDVCGDNMFFSYNIELLDLFNNLIKN